MLSVVQRLAMKINNKNEKRDTLIETYQSFVEKVARKQIKRLNLSIDLLDDLVAAGYLGLVEAADRFNANENNDFEGWAYIRIKGSIIDCLREQHLSRRAYQYSKALKAANNLENEDEREKTHNSIGLKQVLNYLANGAVAFKLSLSDMEERQISDSKTNTPERELEIKQNTKEIKRLIGVLKPKEKIVIEGYYLKDKSFADIARENSDLSKSWISRIHKRALKKLHAEFLLGQYEII